MNNLLFTYWLIEHLDEKFQITIHEYAWRTYAINMQSANNQTKSIFLSA